MARWSRLTLLPPDLWAQLCGFSPCAWAGVRTSDDDRGCEFWYQQPWQAQPPRAGRETVGQAVLQAEARMAARLGFFVAPRYVVDEIQRWPFRSSTVRLRHGYVHDVGVEARDTLEIDAPVVHGDPYAGSWEDDTATITVTVPAGTDPCEIAVYYPDQVSPTVIAADDETWRIRPLKVAVSGTTATITGHRCQFVKWSVHQLGELVPDIGDDSYFLSTVDVFRRYTTYPGAAAVWLDGSACASPPCGEETQSLCGLIDNERLGHVRLAPATYAGGAWAAAAWRTCTLPDQARISYLSGWRDDADPDCAPWGDLDEVIVKLSLTFLRENICQCAQFQWLWDYATKELEMMTRTLAAAYAAFGSTKQGALDAFAWARTHGLNRGRSAT